MDEIVTDHRVTGCDQNVSLAIGRQDGHEIPKPGLILAVVVQLEERRGRGPRTQSQGEPGDLVIAVGIGGGEVLNQSQSRVGDLANGTGFRSSEGNRP